MNDKFTMKEAIEIQEKHVEEWRGVVVDAVLDRLVLLVARKNSKMLKNGDTSPHHVFRGNDIQHAVWIIGQEWKQEQSEQ